MLFKPLLATDLSGKVGGIVASHNAGGAYFRAAVIPTNPNTPQQVTVRNAVASLTSIWSGTLTQDQRDSWDLYAFNVPLTNRIGEQKTVSGLAMYIRTNVTQLQRKQARVDTGPPVFNLGSFSEPRLTNATVGGQTVDTTFVVSPISDAWANETGGALLVFVSRPQNAGIKFFTGPYRFTAFVAGDPITPPTSPITVVVPFAIALGQRLFSRYVTHRFDGRQSTPSRSTIETVA